MVRHNNQLPDNLPQLQNLVKRDPESYKDDFLQQYKFFMSTVEIFKLSPDKESKSLDELVMFLAQVNLLSLFRCLKLIFYIIFAGCTMLSGRIETFPTANRGSSKNTFNNSLQRDAKLLLPCLDPVAKQKPDFTTRPARTLLPTSPMSGQKLAQIPRESHHHGHKEHEC